MAGCCLQGVLQQGDPRHRANAAGHRCDPSGALLRRSKINIAVELIVVAASDADINDRSALFDPITGHKPGFANSADQNIRLACYFSRVFCELVSCCHRYPGQQ